MPEPTNRAVEPSGRLGSQQMELILRQLESLPTLPAIATRLLQLTVSDRAQTEQIVQLIQADQSLTARLLSMAGRADRGMRREARTIDKVVLMLGFDAVRSAVLSIKVFEMFGPQCARAGGLDRAEFWKHCLAVACAAELLARQGRRPEESEEAFVCGLLHDLGKLAFEHCLPKSYARVAETADAQRGDIAEFERRVIGMDHTIVGRRLAQLWHLPATLEQTLWLHHQPVESLPEILPGRRIIALVQLADTIAREQRFGYSGNHTFLFSPAELAERIGLPDGIVDRVREQLPEAIESRAALLGLSEMTSESLYRSALASANAELGRLNEALRVRAENLTATAEAFELLRDFGSRLHGQLTLADLGEVMTQAWARLGQLQPSPAAPVAAYAVSSSDPSIVVVIRTGPENARSVLLPRREDFPPPHVPPPGLPAESVMGQVTANVQRLGDALGQASLVHRPLLCGGRWLGGLLWPAKASPADLLGTTGDSLALTMAFAVSMADARDHANVLAERLGQATQELFATQRELTEARTLAAVGEMAAGAAHEINNPLAVVVGRAELMAESAPNGDRQTWQTIANQAQRISDIVSEMMEFARPAAPHPRPVAAADLVEQARRAAAERPATANLRVEVEVAPQTPPLHVDREQIAGVLVELMSNAAGAYPKDPHVRIEARRDEVSEQVLIRVLDEGSGMDAATVEKAFTPFFSAKPAGRSRGLGLSKARRLVQLAGGRIWLHSRTGEGTIAFLLLPAAEDAAAQSGPAKEG